MPVVKINTSDVGWAAQHGIDAIACGTDARGVAYFQVTVSVPAVERTRFAGADMIRFDLGPDAPRDHNRWAMYPAAYLVEDAATTGATS